MLSIFVCPFLMVPEVQLGTKKQTTKKIKSGEIFSLQVCFDLSDQAEMKAGCVCVCGGSH